MFPLCFGIQVSNFYFYEFECLKSHINRIMKQLSFCDWLILYSALPSQLNHNAAHFFLLKNK